MARHPLAGRPGPTPENRVFRHHAFDALAHPATLAAVAVLLINDHVLKRLAPSVWTGKLSDFAGLFFFPFLLSAAVVLLLRPGGLDRRVRLSSSRLGTACFAATAIGFAAVKTIPAANAAAVSAIESILGLPVSLILDPTDLIALLALIPAWRLWHSLEGRPHIARHRVLTALGLASLATVATSPCPPVLPITHLVALDGDVFALSTQWRPVSSAFRTTDGAHWAFVDDAELPPELVAAAEQPALLPKTVCDPDQADVCYRVSGEAYLQATSDGGLTWETVWRSPTTRWSYMARAASGYGQPLSCPKDLDFSTHDLVILGKGPEHFALAAIGNEGIVRGRVSSEWASVAVGGTRPTPDHGTLANLLPPFIILGETIAAILAGSAVALVLSRIAWKRERISDAGASSLPWVIVGLLVAGVAIVLIVQELAELIPIVILPLTAVCSWIAYLASGWIATLRAAKDSRRARSSLGWSLLGGTLVGLAVWIPFALWVLGVVPPYVLALALSVVLGIAAYRLGLRRICPDAPAVAATRSDPAGP